MPFCTRPFMFNLSIVKYFYDIAIMHYYLRYIL